MNGFGGVLGAAALAVGLSAGAGLALDIIEGASGSGSGAQGTAAATQAAAQTTVTAGQLQVIDVQPAFPA